MVVEVSTELALDIINKSLKISKVFLKCDFKIRLHNKSSTLVVILILGLLKANNTIKK